MTTGEPAQTTVPAATLTPATSINISSAKSTVFLRHLAKPRTNLVLALLSAYLSVIHSSALFSLTKQREQLPVLEKNGLFSVPVLCH